MRKNAENKGSTDEGWETGGNRAGAAVGGLYQYVCTMGSIVPAH